MKNFILKLIFALLVIGLPIAGISIKETYKELPWYVDVLIVMSLPFSWLGMAYMSDVASGGSYGPSPRRSMIQEVYNLRDAKISSMGLSDAQELLLNTQLLDMAIQGGNSNSSTSEAFDLLNAKLASMSAEDGLKYIAQKR